MASSQDAAVLLETVALCSYQGAAPPQAGNIEKAGHTNRVKSKRAMAPGQNPGYPNGHDQQMAEWTGVDIRQRTVGKNTLPDYDSVTLMKRPVRIRMQGVVGGLGEKNPRLPDSANYFVNFSIACGVVNTAIPVFINPNPSFL
jgi:hypothetical protein